MNYNEALQEWGARCLEAAGNGNIARSTVSVETGYTTNGYCETCTYTTSCIEISGRNTEKTYVSLDTTEFNYDMGEFLKEVVEVAQSIEEGLTV